jgi:hypothetical protein
MASDWSYTDQSPAAHELRRPQSKDPSRTDRTPEMLQFVLRFFLI